MPASVAIRHHLAAGVPYARALAEAGHPIVAAGDPLAAGPVDVLLIDLDTPPCRPVIDAYTAAGAKAFLYPHGVAVVHYYDGIEPPYEKTSGMFVIAEGFAEVYRRIGYSKPVYVIGWPYCEQLPFRQSADPRRVLFAPVHPLENGYLSDWQRELNREVFGALLEVPGIELRVRHLKTLEQNGLWREPGVEFVEGQPDNSYADIDRSDVVVASETYAYLAVARGAPTIMFGQHVRPSNGEHPGERVYVENWEAWRDHIRYPLDMRDAPAAELITAAARSDEAIRDWRRLFIGEPLEPRRFSAQVQEALAVARLPETRSLAVVADAGEVAAEPALIGAYARVFGPEDDATLLLLAPGADQDDVVARLHAAFAVAGLDDDTLPDLLLVTDPSTPAGDRALADRAAAVLSARAPQGAFATLPRYDEASVAALRPRAAA